ncbi:MAG: glycosyltransferase family 2 protein [Lachnospiraceae bacterium]|nr:glycosyltransferase family 2 protein [Lachnospiraceae bacterium]
MGTLIRFIKKLNFYNISKGLKYLRHFGVKEFFIRLSDRVEPDEVPYEPWYEKHRASEEELKRQRQRKWKDPLLISIAVPLFRTPPVFLEQMIESVKAQSYPYWELCLANGSPEDAALAVALARYEDDDRIRVQTLPVNRGIAGNTNAAIEMAKGDYIGLLDHDDLLAPDALYEVADAIERGRKESGSGQNSVSGQNSIGRQSSGRGAGAAVGMKQSVEIANGAAGHGRPELLYTDEDKVEVSISTNGSQDGAARSEQIHHFQPNLKPDYSPDLLRSNNYICHFLVFSRALYEKVGGFDSRYDGAQDHDFILRCTEKADGICHIPRILYHWRVSAKSTADNPTSKEYAYEAGVRAVAAHLERCGLKGEVSRKKDFGCYRVKYEVEGNPLVSIVIPNKDETDTLKLCLTSIFEKTTWKNYEIIIVENNSETGEIFDYYKEIDGRNGVHVVYYEKQTGFNYSAINNFGIRHAKGDYILCMNNDMEVISPDWMTELLGHCMRPGTGAVGARLYYPDDTTQHAGIVIGIGGVSGVAGNILVGLKRGHTGYMHRESLQQDLSAVTAACMMIRREAYDAAGGFEEKLAVAFNDVDFCLKVREAGYLVVYDPYAELYHYESKTRGAEDTEEKARRFQHELEYMRTRWIRILKEGDPYYNRNLSLTKWNYSLRNDAS